jgi:hypothetical protein
VRIGIDASRATRLQRTGTENYSLFAAGVVEPGALGNTIFVLQRKPQEDLFPWQPNVRARYLPSRRVWTSPPLLGDARRRPDILSSQPMSCPRFIRAALSPSTTLAIPIILKIPPADLRYLKTFTLSAPSGADCHSGPEVPKRTLEHLAPRGTHRRGPPGSIGRVHPEPEPGERERR